MTTSHATSWDSGTLPIALGTGPSLQAHADREPRLTSLFVAARSCRSTSLARARDCRRRLCCAHAEGMRHGDGKAPEPFPARWQLLLVPLPSPPAPQRCRAPGAVSTSGMLPLPGEPAVSHGPRTWPSVSLSASRPLCESDSPPLKTFGCAGSEGSVGSFIHRESSLGTGRFDVGQPSHRSRTTPSPAGETDPPAHRGDTRKCTCGAAPVLSLPAGSVLSDPPHPPTRDQTFPRPRRSLSPSGSAQPCRDAARRCRMKGFTFWRR